MSSATAPAALTARQREERGLQLRLAGLSYARIGEQLGITGPGAHAAVTRAVRRQAERMAEDAELLRAIEVARLDEAQVVASALLRHQDSATRLRAVDRVVKLGERRAKLLGLDSPVLARVDLGALTDDELQQLADGRDPHAVLTSRPAPQPPAQPPPQPADDEGDDEVEVVDEEGAVIL